MNPEILQDQLARAYKQWEIRHPDTLQWRKKQALQPAWWDVAATACRETGIPPYLLLFVVCRFLNARPEEAEVPFSANVMRSESLIIRAVVNFRWRMNIAFKPMSPLFVLESERPTFVPPMNTLDYARMFADYSCRYFGTMLKIREHQFSRLGMNLPDSAYDLLAYTLCEGNPFLLLNAARTDRFRALAAVNCARLCDEQPWHYSIWEGVACPMSLASPDISAGLPVSDFYADYRPVWSWPENPAEPLPFRQTEGPDRTPTLKLLQFRTCPQTDLYLTMKLEDKKKGQTTCH